MSKNINKLVSSLALLTITLSACGTQDNSTTLVTTDTNSTDSLSSFSASTTNPPAALTPELKTQIDASTIEETEWGTHVKALPVVKAQKKATVLSYLAFDNDKGGYRDELRPMINFHELSGTSNLMNMILQTDGAEKADLKRYMVIGDSDTSKIVSPYTQFKYEMDSGDYRVLQAFTRWGFTNYPSQLKFLDIDNHGGAYLGIGKDDTSGHIIPLPGLAKAIKNSVGKVDILNMDACLMGTIEAIYELKDVADVTIGSEDSTLGTGMMYTKSLPEIIAKNNSVEQIATNVVLDSDRKGKDYQTRPNRKGKIPQVYTITAFRSKMVKPLVTQMDSFAKLLISKLPTQKQALKVAFDGTHPLVIDGDDLGGQRDIYEVLSRINTVVTDPEIRAAVVKTRDAVNKAIVIARTHNAEKNAQGMAINISANAVQNTDYQGTAFAKDTKWDEFITALNQ